MAQEIGVAYVSLLPSGKGFSKGVQTEAESAFKGAEKSSNDFFGGVVSWAKRGALVVGGMVTAVGALALGGGISRALNIEDATAKLKGLGHDTVAVEAIMKDALASVKGTAFGLDAAATTAASAVAAGIKPGQELERYLRLTADAATIAGTSMGEMGDIINQVTSKGYAGMENLNRLTERGIPILQWLQDEYGVTADELQKMVSRGEVDAATFRKAIEDNIGGAALESGNTTRGAFANMLASLSRLGEGFAGPALGSARDFFNEITAITDNIKSTLAPAFEDLQYWVDGLDFTFSDDVASFLTPLLETINDISAATRDGSLGDWLEQVAKFSPTLTALMAIADTVGPLLPLVQDLAEEVGPVLADAFSQVYDALLPVLPILSESLVDAIVELAPPLADLLIALLPIIPPLADLAAVVIPGLADEIETLIPFLAGMISSTAGIWSALGLLFGLLGGDVSLDTFRGKLLSLAGPFGDVLRWADQAGGEFGNFARTVQVKATEVVAWVQGIPARIVETLGNLGNLLVSSGKALMDGFLKGIQSMTKPIGDAVSGVLDWVSGFFPHSPAERGPFSGSGWTAVADGGASLMEQFAFGAVQVRPQISFKGIFGDVPMSSVASPVSPVVNQYNTFENIDPRLAMRQLGREAGRALAAI